VTLPTRVGVYGGGRMGAGIAHAFLASGAAVTVVETTEATAAAARGRVESALSRGFERDNAQIVDALSRLTVANAPEHLEGCSLVIEAVPEQASLKQEVLARIERAAPDAWLATNTSSLSINTLASALNRRDRFAGLHFFNPVPASRLVEIVTGAATSAEFVELASEWVADLGKSAITVNDAPGFASSRLGVAIALEAMRMLEEGVASAQDIDTAMELGYRHPTGPLRTTDVVGLDVRLAIAEHLARELGGRFDPPAILREKVAVGDLGRKTGRGFFTW
jgi:3-hydroxybutyryl-CoA dehydrogenase